MICFVFALITLLTAAVTGKVYFKEDFNDAAWTERWTVPSDWKRPSELGNWIHTAGEYYGIPSDKGIQIGQAARFYSLSAKLDTAITNRDKELVIQMTVKHEHGLFCGGAFIKLLGDMDQSKFGGDTPYQILFGPDSCDSVDLKTLVAFNHPPENKTLHIKDHVRAENDLLTHLYTLVVKPDNTFEVLIDLEPVKSGSLAANWDFPPSHRDKGTDLNGSSNDEGNELHVRCIDCTHVGLEFWHSSVGTLFDDILITDSFEEAETYAQETFLKKRDPEKEAYETKMSQSDGRVVLRGQSHFGTFGTVPSQHEGINAAQWPFQMSQLAQNKDTYVKLEGLPVTLRIANPLNGCNVIWSPLINAGAAHNVMDSKTASLLGLKPGHACTVENYSGWMSTVTLTVQDTPAEIAVCVSPAAVEYNLLGRPLLEKHGLCHCPRRGLVQCRESDTVFAHAA